VPGQPVITLCTDFGEGSPYVATLKAVLLRGCPQAVLVDVTHSVPPFDIVAGAFMLWAGTQEFGPGSVHLAVVDPGVGGARRALAVEVGGRFYVAPDNGLLGLVLEHAAEPAHTVELVRPVDASRTFEGRDRFAPAAARLACGARLDQLGSESGPPHPLEATGPRVLWIDNFGNVVTSLDGPVAGLSINGHAVRGNAGTYSEAHPGVPFLYLGSLGYLEVGVPGARADDYLGASIGMPIQVEPS
jgi:S-adenosylmethionine hydrolase